MEVFDLFARISLDTTEYVLGLLEARGKLEGLGGVISSTVDKMVEIGKAAAATIMAAAGASATAVSMLANRAVSGYAEYEQLVGGVETLFQTSADTIKGYADEAYRTAGMTANEYMETVTSFAASLIQATGRGMQTDIDLLEGELDAALAAQKRAYEDEYKEAQRAWKERLSLAKKEGVENYDELVKQKEDELAALKRSNKDKLAEMEAANKQQIESAEKANSASTTTAESLAVAADVANMAIIDMSDNANKMGTSMTMILNAYQGFAKQNYTMLDNLKLGYGGTQKEMQRLLAEAERVTGQKYDISNLSDVINAIHVIQGELGITGATADEASKTISGAAGSMQAAWHNLVVGLANGDADLGKLIENFVVTAETSFDNFLPTAERALGGISELVARITPILIEKIPGIVDKVLPPLKSATKEIMGALMTAIPGLFSATVEAVPEIIEGGKTLISKMAQGISDNAPTIIGVAQDALTWFVDGLVGAIPILVEQVPVIIGKVKDAVIEYLPIIIDEIGNVISDLATELGDAVPMIKPLTDIVRSLGENFDILAPTALGAIAAVKGFQGVSALVSSVSGAMSALSGVLGAIASPVGIVTAAIAALVSGFVYLYNTNDNFAANVQEKWAQIKEAFVGLQERIEPAIERIGEGFGGIGEKLESAMQTMEPVFEWLFNVVAGTVKGVIEAIGPLTDMSADLFNSIDHLFGAIGSLFSGDSEGFREHVKGMFDDLVGSLASAFEAIGALLKGVLEGMGVDFDGIVEWIKGTWERLGEWFNGTVDWVKGVFEDISKAVVESPLWETVTSLFESMKELFSNVFDKAKEIWTELFDFIKSVAISFWEWAKIGFETVKSVWLNLFETLKGVASPVLESIKFIFTTIFDSIVTVVKTAVAVVKNTFSTIAEVFRNVVNAVKALFHGDFQGALNFLGAAVRSAKDGVVNSFRLIFDGVKDIVTGFIDKAKSWGKDLIDNFVGGVREKIDWIKETFSGIGSTIKSFIGFSEPEKGPLSNFHTYAPDMMKLFAEGIRENEGLVTDQLRRSFDFSDVLADQTVAVSAQPYTVGAGGQSIVMNIYGAAGQDVNELAEIISRRLEAMTSRRQMAMGAP